MLTPLIAEVEPRGFSWRRAFAFSAVLWLGMLLVDIAKDSLAAYLLDQPVGWHIARTSAMWWPVLIPLTPLVLALAHRVPIRRNRWAASVGVHVGAGIVFALAHLLLTRVVVLYRVDLLTGEIFWRTFRTSFNAFFLFDVLIYVALVAGYWATDYYRRYRDRAVAAARAESLAARAQVDALRWQLNPHFLFNSLNAAAGLVRSGDSRGGVEMLARISALLRSTLDESSGADVTLARELELVELYTDIERVRFRDRLTVEVDIDGELLDARVPALILQPLVENAVRHGVSSTASAVRVAVEGRRTATGMTISVRDDGAGFERDPSSIREGVGLSNTRERLQYRFGAGASLELSSVTGGGGRVDLHLPYERTAA